MDCPEAFTAELVETYGPIDAAPDVGVKPTEDFTELITRGKLGSNLVPMRVGSGSAKQ